MENSEPNKIINKLVKRYLENQKTYIKKITPNTNIDKNLEYWERHKTICKEFESACYCVGFVECLSKKNIFRLVTMQRKLRFLNEHRFYTLFNTDELDTK